MWGFFFGGRDHTTVMHAIKTIEEKKTKKKNIDENIAQIFLYVSYDGSNYNYVTSWRCGQHDDGVHNTITQSYILDVDNTSNVKFYFATDSMGGSSQLRGDADIGESNVTITRLGDT